MQRIPREAGQAWREYLDLASPGWRYEMAPGGRPFFPQGQTPPISQATLTGAGGSLDLVLAEFKCNANEFIVIQYAGVEALFRTPDQALGTPSVRIPPGDLGLGAWWAFRWKSANDTIGRAAALARSLEGVPVGPTRGGYFRMEFLNINNSWLPLDYEGEGDVQLVLSLRSLGNYADNAILTFNGQFSGYSAPIPPQQQQRPYPYGPQAGPVAPMWNPLERNR